MNIDGVNAHHDERQRNRTNSKTSRDNGGGEKKVMFWIKTMEMQEQGWMRKRGWRGVGKRRLLQVDGALRQSLAGPDE